MQQKDIAILAARCADEKKAEDVKLLDLNGLSSLCDYIVLATVTSKPHLEAVEDEISTRLKKIGVYKLNRDGGESMIWRVSDYGSFLVHIMTQQAREFYALDKIFSFATTVKFQKPKTTKKTTVKKTAAKKTTSKKAAPKTAAKKTASSKTTKKSNAKKTAKTVKKSLKKVSK